MPATLVGCLQGDRNPKRRAKRLHDLSDVSSVGIMARGALDEYRFNMYIRDLLSEKAKDIFRCKGVLSVHVSCWGKGSADWLLCGAAESGCRTTLPHSSGESIRAGHAFMNVSCLACFSRDIR
jgi:hypothetical protein